MSSTWQNPALRPAPTTFMITTLIRPAPPAATAPSGRPREFLAFEIDAQEYGVDILQVREIRAFEAPVPLANAPEHLLGRLNLRGVFVPVIDLRLHFGARSAAFDERTVVIVLQGAERLIGAVVDAVSDVIAFHGEQIRALPTFHPGVTSDHLLAIASFDDRTLTLLDLDKLLASPALGLAAASTLN